MVYPAQQTVFTCAQTCWNFHSKHQRKSGAWRTSHVCSGIDFSASQARLAVDRRIHLAQKKLLSWQVAESISGRLGTVFAIQQDTPLQNESGSCDGANG